MLRERTLFKFKCKELFCGNYVRSDKWVQHCRSKHASKFHRGIDVQYEIWAIKEENCEWREYATAQQNANSTESESTQVADGSAETSSSVGLPVPADMCHTTGATDTGVNNKNDDSHGYLRDSGTQVENTLTVCFDEDNNRECETTELTELTDEVANSLQTQMTGIKNTNADEHRCASSSSESEVEMNLAPDDPAGYAGLRIDSLIIESLLNKPVHPPTSFMFPSKSGRQCSKKWFTRSVPGQTPQTRKWLSYSVSADKLYCIHCMSFGGPVAADSVVWVKNGYDNWSKLARDIPNHEDSPIHKTSEGNRLSWLYRNRVDGGPSISARLTLVESRRRVVAVEIKAIQCISREMVALRGYGCVGGKFLSQYKLLAEYDASAKAYLDHLDNIRQNPVRRKPEVNILSPRNVRCLLNVMKTKTVQCIVERMKQSGVCSIINDGTQDLSKLEASCLLIRYIEGDGSC